MPLPAPEVLWFLGSPIQDAHPQKPLFGCWLLSQLYALRVVEKESKNFQLLLDANHQIPYSLSYSYTVLIEPQF